MNNEILVSNGYTVSEEELQDFITDALVEGISHWAIIDKSRHPDFWKEYDRKNEYMVDYIYRKLKEGEVLMLIDRENDNEYFVTLRVIKKVLSEQTRFDFENYDAEDCDWVMQMAMFGEVIYG
jgi:hypothetical protein